MKLIDPDHPFFVPVWRRWLVSGGPLAWAVFELATGNAGWAVLFGAAGAYAFYELIIRGPAGN